jgi:hypothetical protein
MTIVAMPVFRSRIAPVLDSCLRVLVIQIDHDGQTEKSELNFNGLSLFERSNALKRAGVTTLICGGISKDLRTAVGGARIGIVSGIVGPVEEVFSAFLSDRLDDPRFYMPGRRRKYGRPRQSRDTQRTNIMA